MSDPSAHQVMSGRTSGDRAAAGMDLAEPRHHRPLWWFLIFFAIGVGAGWACLQRLIAPGSRDES